MSIYDLLGGGCTILGDAFNLPDYGSYHQQQQSSQLAAQNAILKFKSKREEEERLANKWHLACKLDKTGYCLFKPVTLRVIYSIDNWYNAKDNGELL